MLLANLGLATTENAITPFLAQAATVAASQTSGAQWDKTLGLVRDLSKQLKACQTLAQQVSVLNQSNYAPLKVNALINRALDTGSLVSGPEAFHRIYFPEPTSAQLSTSTIVGQELQKGGAVAQRTFAAVSASLGWTATSDAEAMASNLMQYPTVAEASRLISRGSIQAVAAHDLSENLQKRVTQRLAQLPQFGAPAPLMPGVSEPEPPRWPVFNETYKECVASAGALRSVLLAVGAREEANFVNNGIGYAQSAAQIYQSVELIASVSSGWGAVTAVSGVLGGSSGLNVFGRNGVGAQDNAGQQQVLDALKELKSYMAKEFAGVNRKLDILMDQLDKVLAELQEVRVELDKVYTGVQQIQRQVNQLAYQVGQGFFIEAVGEVELSDAVCTGKLERRSLVSQTVAGCKLTYAFYGGKVASDPYEWGSSGPDADLLYQLFGPRPQKNLQDTWSAAAYVKSLLPGYVPDYGSVKTGAPANEPILRKLLEGYCDWDDVVSPELRARSPVTSDREVASLRGVARNHRLFVDSLREPVLPGRTFLIDQLVGVYGTMADNLKKSEVQLREDLVNEQLATFFNESNKPTVDRRVYMDNANLLPTRAPSNQLLMFTDYSYGDGADQISPYYGFAIEATGMELTPTAARLRVFASVDLTPGVPNPTAISAESIRVNLDIWMYGQSIALVKPTGLRIGSVNLNGVTIDVKKDPVFYLYTGGRAGMDPLLGVVREALRNPALVERVRQMHLTALRQATAVQQKKLADAQGRLPLADPIKLGNVLRAVFRLGYPETTLAQDSLMALLEGPTERRLLDSEMVDIWSASARATGAAPAWGPTPGAIAVSRCEELKKLVPLVRSAAEKRGPSFGFEAAYQRFENEFPVRYKP